MARVFLILGSNLDNRLNYLAQARDQLSSQAGKIIQASAIYESEPWGFETDLQFLNQVVMLETSLSPENLLKMVNHIENHLGRIRGEERYVSRTMDIDILFYEDLIVDTKELTIPHPQIQFRRFVLFPLNEIAPAYRHPVLKETIHTLFENCKDHGNVRQI